MQSIVCCNSPTTKRKNTKSSATEAPWCIKLLQCGSAQKFGNKRFDEQSRQSNMYPPPSTQQLMPSERHRRRRYQTRDASLSMQAEGVPHRATSADKARETPGQKIYVCFRFQAKKN